MSDWNAGLYEASHSFVWQRGRGLVEMLAPQYPDVNFIIPHLGSFADDFRAQQQVVDQLVRYPNVYADTAGVRRFDYIVQAVKRAGPRKVPLGAELAPYSLWNPILPGHKGLPRKDRFIVRQSSPPGLTPGRLRNFRASATV